MKKVLVIFNLFVFGFVFSQQIELNTSVLDLGQVTKGEKVSSVIKIKNNGNIPLIISKVVPSCGCTVPEVPKKPIMPGKSTDLKISYQDSKSGPFNKVVEIYSNDKKASRKVVRIKGNIK